MARLAIPLAALAWLFASPSLAQQTAYVVLDANATSGGRSLRAALPPLARARDAIRACGVARAVSEAPTPSDGAAFTIGIGRDGHVESLRIGLPDAARDASWLSCIEAAVRTVRFVRAPAPTSITGTIRFVSPTAEALLGMDLHTVEMEHASPPARGRAPCAREARDARTSERQLGHARTSAARAGLQARVASAQQALSACLSRTGLGNLASAAEAPDRGQIRGRVTIGDAELLDGEDELDPAFVSRVIRSRLSAIRACYERRLRVTPTLAGRDAIDFVISTSGAVSEVHVEENSTDQHLVACVAGIVRGLRFDPRPSRGPVRFATRFWFAPVEIARAGSTPGASTMVGNRRAVPSQHAGRPGRPHKRGA